MRKRLERAANFISIVRNKSRVKPHVRTCDFCHALESREIHFPRFLPQISSVFHKLSIPFCVPIWLKASLSWAPSRRVKIDKRQTSRLGNPALH
jgi:hypothetical protein